MAENWQKLATFHNELCRYCQFVIVCNIFLLLHSATTLTAADVVIFVFTVILCSQRLFAGILCHAGVDANIARTNNTIDFVYVFIVCTLFASYRSHRKHIISYNSFGFRFFFFFFIQSLRFFLRPSRFFTLCLSLDSLHARYLYYLWLQSF